MTNQSPALPKPINVDQNERLLSLVAGPVLMLIGLRPRGWQGVALALLGAVLIYRGATGHCPVYATLDIDRGGTRSGARPGTDGHHIDPVQQTSEESFPASDPPGWTAAAP